MNASLQKIFAIFMRQFFILKRSPNRIFALFYWSLLELFLWGVLTIYLDRTASSDVSFIASILGAVILWNMLFRIQNGIAISFLEDVWTRNLINLFASPLTLNQYLLGLIVTSVAEAVVTFFFLVFVAWFLFAYNVFQFGFFLIPFLAVLFVFGWALGVLATAIILRLGPSSEIFAWSIPAFFTPLSGVFYPISALPKVLQPIASFLPTSQVFEGMRAVILTGEFDARRLLTALLLSVFALAVAYAMLLLSYRSALRQGLVTRFLTE